MRFLHRNPPISGGLRQKAPNPPYHDYHDIAKINKIGSPMSNAPTTLKDITQLSLLNGKNTRFILTGLYQGSEKISAIPSDNPTIKSCIALDMRTALLQRQLAPLFLEKKLSSIEAQLPPLDPTKKETLDDPRRARIKELRTELSTFEDIKRKYLNTYFDLHEHQSKLLKPLLNELNKTFASKTSMREKNIASLQEKIENAIRQSNEKLKNFETKLEGVKKKEEQLKEAVRFLLLSSRDTASVREAGAGLKLR